MLTDTVAAVLQPGDSFLPVVKPVGLEYTNVAAASCLRHAARLSGGDVVLVDEAAKDLFSVDSMLSEVDLRWPSMSLSRRQLVQGAMWPGCVVAGQVFGQYLAQLVLVDNQHAVEQLAAQGSDHPFAGGVRSGRLRRAEQDPGASCGEYRVEGARELPGTVPDQELDVCGRCARRGP